MFWDMVSRRTCVTSNFVAINRIIANHGIAYVGMSIVIGCVSKSFGLARWPKDEATAFASVKLVR